MRFSLFTASFTIICFAFYFGQKVLAQPVNSDSYTLPTLSYQFIGEDDLPNASLRQEQFLEQLSVIKKNFRPVSASVALDIILGKKKSLPGDVFITFDMGLKNQFRSAFPLLIKQKIPFLVFIDPQVIDQADPLFLTWDQISDLSRNSDISFGYLPVTPLPQNPETLSARLNAAQARLREKTGHSARFFAFTDGFIDASIFSALKKANFSIAFTQASGPASSQSSLYAQPRFVMTENYGDHARFIRALHSLPLPVTDITPQSSTLKQNPPLIGFTLAPEFSSRFEELTCFASDNIKTQKIRIENNRIELRLEEPFPADRGRVNCIMPEGEEGQDQRWRWLGLLFGN